MTHLSPSTNTLIMRRSPAQVTRLVREFTDRVKLELSKHRFRVTDNRIEMASVLADSSKPVNAPQIVRLLSNYKVDIEHTSVYRSLDIFETCGLVYRTPEGFLPRWTDSEQPVTCLIRRGDDYLEVPISDDLSRLVIEELSKQFPVTAVHMTAI